ncbi:hypothetical protein VP01_3242g4 [Puccinia sorghi]|uniref:DDE Tnp4 domain-containing protein n=1 Tax=Puccinia sorghi TaxID=27349 RepID=A0A0L6UY05_9BASI|nr:hypothetical protein VP01_3242g4 [Puccinia sorghi]
MSHQSFDSLLSLIQNHPVFYSNSNVPQQPVRNQLMVTLRKMGTSGNGSAIGMLARFFRISEGAVILYCHRVVEAILALENRSYVSWPNCNARKPLIDAQDYYSRKGLYGLAALVLCDRNKQITYYITGWPDSGFPTKTTLVPEFKKPPHRPIPQLKKKFNQHLASLRVCNKRCIGILKGRFQSLSGACVVLHKFLLNNDSPLID